MTPGPRFHEIPCSECGKLIKVDARVERASHTECVEAREANEEPSQ